MCIFSLLGLPVAQRFVGGASGGSSTGSRGFRPYRRALDGIALLLAPLLPRRHTDGRATERERRTL